MDISRRHQVRDITRHIGERIRYGRALRDVSQEKLGAALGVSFQQVQKYESGANRVAACTLVAIAQELQLDVGFFLRGETGAINPVEVANARREMASLRASIDDAVGTLTTLRDRLPAGVAETDPSPDPTQA